MAPRKSLLIYGLLLLLLSENVYTIDVFNQIVEDDVDIKHDAPRAVVAKFAFAKHFQDNMVLQKAPKRANVYGFSPNIGEKVTLQFVTAGKAHDYETTVKAGTQTGSGVWSITLDPFDSKTTGDIKVTSKGESLEISNIIFGDVWICSGQSNMAFTLNGIDGSAQEIADAHNYPNIRLMTVKRKLSETPLSDLTSIQQIWTKPDNTNVGLFSAVCWLYGKAIHKALDTPIGLVASDWGGTPVAAWSSTDALAKCGTNANSRDLHTRSSEIMDGDTVLEEERLTKRADTHTNSVLWNAMIQPLSAMTIYGVIWYQGEADSREPSRSLYNCTFPSMIEDWRSKFNTASSGQTSDDFPFGFVQLAPNKAVPVLSAGFPDIRWHQTADYGYVPNPVMKNVFMAVAMDLPDFHSPFGSIHPRYKKEVGARLALSGLAVAYGKSEMFQGPFPQNIEFASGDIFVDYGSKWELDIRDWYGFEYLCPTASSSSWLPTNIIHSNTTSITLKGNICDGGKVPKGLRYAWRTSPCDLKKCSVYGKVNELPAPPFVLYPTA